MKKSRIRFYSVSVEYINYLKKYETRIPNIVYERREKFLTGVLFKVKGMSYFAPVSSFNRELTTNFVLKSGEYILGSIRFSFMFPVPPSEIKAKDFSTEDPRYKRLIERQVVICNKNSSAIRKRATEVYINVKLKNPKYTSFCCNFTILEKKCEEWNHIKNINNESNDFEKEEVEI